MQRPPADSVQLHYMDEGTGPPLLFVHGTPTWSFEWRHLIAGLRDTHRCIAPDNLGFGKSPRPADADYSPAAHADRLREFVTRLGLDDLTLVVHDFGGLIGLPLAIDPPRIVRRLVVINSWMWHLGEDPAVARGARLLGGRLGRFLYERLNFSLRAIMPAAFADRKRLTPEIHQRYLEPFPDARSRGLVLWPLAQALRGPAPHADRLWNARAALSDLPTLIVWGLRDPALKPHQLDRWRSALPQAQVVTLEVGHWPQEEAPDQVLSAMRGFLNAPLAASP